MRILSLFALFLFFGCSQTKKHLEEDKNTASMECLLDAYLAELPPANDQALWVHESIGWTDTTSMLIVSAYDLDYLDQEIARGKQEATYRGYQVLYQAERIGFPKANITAEELLPSTLTWAPIDTSRLPSTVMAPPYDPPVAQVVYNHERQLFEDILLITSALEVPSCSKAK